MKPTSILLDDEALEIIRQAPHGVDTAILLKKEGYRTKTIKHDGEKKIMYYK